MFQIFQIFQNTNEKIWQISALKHLKSGQIKKIKALYYIKYPIIEIKSALVFLIWPLFVC